MDIISHGLWGGILGKFLKTKKKKIRPFIAGLWGLFPDLFAFGIPFLWVIISMLSGDVNINQLSHRRMESAQLQGNTMYELSHIFYNLSHSIIVWSLVIVIIYLIFKKFHYEMLGWLLHIIMDIPTHTYQYYPTPFLWPLSEYRFDGFSWGQPWFMVLNYSMIVILFLFLKRASKHKKKGFRNL